MRVTSLIPLAGLAATGANAFLLPPNLDTATLRVTEDIKIDASDENVKPNSHDEWDVKLPCNNCFYEPTGSSDSPSNLMFAIAADRETNQLKLAGKTIWPAKEHDKDFMVTHALTEKPADVNIPEFTVVRPFIVVVEEIEAMPEIGGEAVTLSLHFAKVNEQVVDIPALNIWAFKTNEGTIQLGAVATSNEHIPAPLAPHLMQCDKFDFFCRAGRILSSAKEGGKDVLAKLPFMPMPFHRGSRKPCKGAKGHGHGRPHLHGGVDKFADSITPFHPHHHEGKIGEFAGALTPFHPHHHHNHDDKVFAGAVGKMGHGPHHGGPRPMHRGPCLRAKMAHMGHALKHVLVTFILPILAGMMIGIIVPAFIMTIFTVVRTVFFPRREIVVPAVIVTEYDDEKSAFKRSEESGEESEKVALMVDEEDLPPYVAKE